MRASRALVVPTTLITGVLLALPSTAASAAAPASSAPAAAASRSALLTLPTGDHVRVGPVEGKQRVQVSPAATAGPGRLLDTQRLGTDVYVTPAVAKPYLGRTLDRNLFDVTRLSAAVGPNGRIPLVIAYTGAKPAVPGVTITSATGGTAKGYVTPDSAAAFGAALTKQFTADAKAGFPKRSTIFTGVTRIAADVPGSTVVTPKFPMFTLSIRTIAGDGTPQEFGDGILVNMDDARKFGGFVTVIDGEGRVSLPAGHYSFVGADYAYDEATDVFTERLATVSDFTVAGAGETLKVDYRTATVAPGVTTPKPSRVAAYTFDWERTDAAKRGGIGWSTGSDGSGVFLVAPAPEPKVGTLGVSQNWSNVAPGSAPAYTYDLAAAYDHIPASLKKTFTAKDMATIAAKYYTDGPDRSAGFLRFPVYPFAFFVGGFFHEVQAPTSRTEYVASTGGPKWGESYASSGTWDDPGFWDGAAWRVIPAGEKSTSSWLRGPLGANLPRQVPGDEGLCYGCRTSTQLFFALAPGVDSDGHTLELYSAGDGLPVARTRFYRNDVLLSDQDDYFGGLFDVPAASSTYKAIIDVNRRLTDPLQSTQSNTVLTFKSAAGQGGTVPPEWYCLASETGAASECRVVPLVTAKLSLPTTLRGKLPAGKSKVTVTVSRAQGAAAGTIASAGLQYRPAGWSWETVPLTAAGNGVYTGIVDNAGFEGANVDVLVSGADTAGNGFSQTVVRAYTVAN